jgi:hypothetical protein
MGPETIATLVVVGVVVAVLALYLIAYTVKLSRLSFTLGTVLVGVRAIAHRTAPVNDVVGGIAGDVAEIDDALGALLALAERQTAAEPEPEPGTAVGAGDEAPVGAGVGVGDGPTTMRQAVARARRRTAPSRRR